MPIWVSRFAGLAVLVPMAAVALTTANIRWLRIERMVIILSAVVYVASTIVELADIIGIITLHPRRAAQSRFLLHPLRFG
jgi:hypothetical protein